MSMSERQINDLLDRFLIAWRERDLNDVMSMFAEDCIYRASVGPEPGETCRGQKEVRSLVKKMFKLDAESEATVASQIIGAQSCAAWKWTYRFKDGTVEYGCDFFEFRDGKISLKDAYRKIDKGQ